jgi:hypothetical protein
MEALDGQDDLILPGRLPGIDIESRKFELTGKSFFCRSRSASIQDFRIQIQAFEVKVFDILLE